MKDAEKKGVAADRKSSSAPQKPGKKSHKDNTEAMGHDLDYERERKETDSDVTEDDIQALGPLDLSMDMGEDEQLRKRVWPPDFAGDDLDVPGSEADDDAESLGSEDEENNLYSLGGDRHEDLEEDKG